MRQFFNSNKEPYMFYNDADMIFIYCHYTTLILLFKRKLEILLSKLRVYILADARNLRLYVKKWISGRIF